MFILPLLGSPAVATEYKVVDVRRHAIFAGKLGQRVNEDLVVEHDGMKILIHVAGSYHTMCVRPNQRIQVGDTVTIRGNVEGEKVTVSRDRIRKS